MFMFHKFLFMYNLYLFDTKSQPENLVKKIGAVAPILVFLFNDLAEAYVSNANTS